MSRRRKKQSLLEDALESRWPLSAILAVGCFLLGYVFLPAVLRTNPFTASLVTLGHKGFGFLGLFFAGIALFKFVAEILAMKHSVSPVLDMEAYESKPLRRINTPPKDSEGAWSVIDVTPTRRPESRPVIKPTSWSLELLQAIEWKRFEDLCAAFYRESGIRSETTPLGADGGIDIRLYQDEGSPNATAIVQCKAWGERWVGIKPIRELLGVMTHEKIEKAFFMVPGGFTDEARKFAATNRITLLDGKLFLAMLGRLPEESNKRLLMLATEGDYTTPTCPACGVAMVRRTGRKGNFWGCRNYPRCRQMLSMRKTVT